MIDIKQIKAGDFVRNSPLAKTECRVLAVDDKKGLIKVRFIDNDGKPCEIEYYPNELYPLEIKGVGTMPDDDLNIEYKLPDGSFYSAPCAQVAKIFATAEFQRKNYKLFLSSDNRTPILVFDQFLSAIPLDIAKEAELKTKGNYEFFYKKTYEKLAQDYNV